MKKMAKKNGMTLLNTIWSNGIWKRTEGEKKSILDYAMIEEYGYDRKIHSR